MPHRFPALLVVASLALLLAQAQALAQEKSVKPGINEQYEKDPDPAVWAKRFELESREVFAHRNEILAACKVKPGMAVADVGAGTGLFTRMFARAVGDEGKVYAVDIAPNFVKYVERLSAAANLKNITGIVCKPDDACLPEDAIDLAFVCDTYHHFEFPYKTLASIHKALKPGGRLVVVDFVRIEGVSSDWTLNHVRAGQEVFRREIERCGFRLVEEPAFLKENYLMVFEKAEAPATQPTRKGTTDEHG